MRSSPQSTAYQPVPVPPESRFMQYLYQEHGRALYISLYRLTGGHHAAEDIVQETFIRAWRHRRRLIEEPGSVRGWLLKVSRNIAIDQDRACKRRPHELTDSPPESDPAPDPCEAVVDQVLLRSALGELTPDHRAVLTGLYWRDLSVAETARLLAVPEGTVKSRSHHALRALRRQLCEPA